MLAVIFEVWPEEARQRDYLDLAEALRSDLEGIDGFLSIERFESLHEPGKLLSLSFWRDEQAIEAWRTHVTHEGAQVQGRGGVFKTYRLRVAAVVRDYGLDQRAQAPSDRRALFG
jgi:heme-degrading monooxygenase HmoA